MVSSQELSEKDFSFVQNMIYEKTGIVIANHKREMLSRRLVHRIRDLNLSSSSDYCSILRSNNEIEIVNFINAITTNLTSFFRENHHFDFLKNIFFPELIKSGKRRLRIWSSASSTGEEPYSIAITMLNSLEANLYRLDATILATDLDTQVLKIAKQGIYDENRVKDLSEPLKKSLFDMDCSEKNKYRIKQKIKDLITYKQLNLIGPWPMKENFDVIFCRNVLIYFDRSVQERLVNRFLNILQPNGLLILGHSESVLKGSKNFEHLGKTIYRKIKN